MSQAGGKSRNLRGAVQLAHFFLRGRVRPGDRVVDATCGNGHDTLLLAKLLGEEGRVWSFDIQPQALDATRALLAQHGCLDRVEIVHAGHECLAEVIAEPLAAVVFNLGYLPGGDKGIVTRPESTLAALSQAAVLLASGGLLAVCVYTGHPGGLEEGVAVERWASALPSEEFNVWTSRQTNRPATAPRLVLIEKIP